MYVYAYFHFRWDPSSNEWTEGIPMIKKRAAHCSVLLNGFIYAIGGRTKKKFFGNVEAFNISKRTWEIKASMSIARSFCAVNIQYLIYLYSLT